MMLAADVMFVRQHASTACFQSAAEPFTSSVFAPCFETTHGLAPVARWLPVSFAKKTCNRGTGEGGETMELK